MQKGRAGFTLIEVLIATALLAIVLVGLYGVLDTQRRSVANIRENLERSIDYDRAVMVLYSDILQSDGNITLKKGERDTLCMEATTNSLYGLSLAKVCWLVLKDQDTLVRIEGNGYRLPVGLEQQVAIDRVIKGTRIFDITRKGGALLVVLQEVNKEPYSFLLQGVKPPPKPKKKKPKKRPAKSPDTNSTKGDNNKTLST